MAAASPSFVLRTSESESTSTSFAGMAERKSSSFFGKALGFFHFFEPLNPIIIIIIPFISVTIQ
jgi:hypothetical protein